MFSPELARAMHADREREIREHIRTRTLLKRAREDVVDPSPTARVELRQIGRHSSAARGAVR